MVYFYKIYGIYCLFDREINNKIFQHKLILFESFYDSKDMDYELFAKTNFKVIRYKFREKLYAKLKLVEDNSSIDKFLEELELRFSFPKIFVNGEGKIYVSKIALKRKDKILEHIPLMVERAKYFFT